MYKLQVFLSGWSQDTTRVSMCLCVFVNSYAFLHCDSVFDSGTDGAFPLDISRANRRLPLLNRYGMIFLRWEKGDGRLLPEFQSYRDLYEHKLRQQEAMSKQLRRQQRSIKEDEAGNTKQRKMFASLRDLLRCKLNVAGRSKVDVEQRDGPGDLFGGFSGAGDDGGRQGNSGVAAGAGKAGSGGMFVGIAGRGAGGAGGAGAGGVDEVYLKAVEAHASSVFTKGSRHGGAPDIMTLDRD